MERLIIQQSSSVYANNNNNNNNNKYKNTAAAGRGRGVGIQKEALIHKSREEEEEEERGGGIFRIGGLSSSSSSLLRLRRTLLPTVRINNNNNNSLTSHPHHHQPTPIISPSSSVPPPAIFITKALSLGTVALLSTILLTAIHPIIAPPAFATFQTVAVKAGAPLRTELLTSAWTGFFAGCLHTLSGPDHLAALAPLSIGRTRMESAAVGALWGCGHDAGQVIFGLLFLVLKDRLHIEIIRTWGTRVVGLTLLVIGAMGIKEAREAATTPCVVLENGECDVSGTYEDMDSPTPVKKKKIGFATFATGVVHGLQPDALMMVLPALALPSRLAGAAFLGMFLVGTVISMGSYTVFIGSCSQALKERVPRITEKLTWASSLVAIAFGLAIIISQYFGFNLY